MIRDFGIVWRERDLLLSGLANTIVLRCVADLAALLLGASWRRALMSQRWPLAAACAASSSTRMRCIPFLLFAYIVYYGLPSLGINLDNWSAGLAALTIYNTAYMAEILRGAWAAQPREPIDAGYRLRLSRGCACSAASCCRRCCCRRRRCIGNQLIQIIKDSAFLTIIALPELTHAASSIQSRHYVPFAAFITAVLLYWGLCLMVEAAVNGRDRRGWPTLAD